MQKVLVENNADGTTLITMNRPEKRNAICAETALLLQKAFLDFEASHTQKCAVITGAGNEAFSGGADTGNFPELWRCIPTVGFQTENAIDHVHAGLVEFAGPFDVVFFVKARFQFDQRCHLFSLLARADQCRRNR